VPFWPEQFVGEALPDSSPGVEIVWPRQGDAFSWGILIKIKAGIDDRSEPVEGVEFFAGTSQIGTVERGPFTLLWSVRPHGEGSDGFLPLQAVAVHTSGERSYSKIVLITYYSGGPPAPVLEIISPRDGAMLASPATFEFAAEMLASVGDASPVEFYAGTNLLGVATEPAVLTADAGPSVVTVTDLGEGKHELRARFKGVNWTHCACPPITITVAQLGIEGVKLMADGSVQMDIVTSFPGRETVIESSPDLMSWTKISATVPSGDRFRFNFIPLSDSGPQFYRMSIPAADSE
jgi:hypothetical protein